MLFAELLAVIIVFVVAAGYFLPYEKRPKIISGLPFILVIPFYIQLFSSQFRWEAVPLYLLGLAFLINNMITLSGRKPKFPAILNKAVITLCMLVCVMSVLLIVVLPVLRLPMPTGTYTVGTMNFQFTDTSRSEIFTDNSSDKRTLFVKAWYPAVKMADLKLDRYSAYLKGDTDLPRLMMIYLKPVVTYSYVNAPLAGTKKKFPVILFSHGHGGNVTQNTVQMEELASHGYVVFSISHTYEAATTVFPDGKVVPEDKQKCRELEYSPVSTNKLRMSDFEPNMSKAFNVRVDDVKFMLDKVTEMNSDVMGFFHNRLNTSKIGVFGYSLGGATMERASLLDSRITAGIRLDSSQEGYLPGKSMNIPFMVMTSDERTSEEPAPDSKFKKSGIPRYDDFVFKSSADDVYSIRISGAYHNNYNDMNVLPGIWKHLNKLVKVNQELDSLGDISSRDMTQILNNSIVSFFDKYLMGKNINMAKRLDYTTKIVKLRYRLKSNEGRLAHSK